MEALEERVIKFETFQLQQMNAMQTEIRLLRKAIACIATSSKNRVLPITKIAVDKNAPPLEIVEL